MGEKRGEHGENSTKKKKKFQKYPQHKGVVMATDAAVVHVATTTGLQVRPCRGVVHGSPLSGFVLKCLRSC